LIDGFCQYLDGEAAIEARLEACGVPAETIAGLAAYYATFDPSTDNIMSYYPFPSSGAEPIPPCGTEFTAIQVDRSLHAVEHLDALQGVRSDLILSPWPGSAVFLGESFPVTWRIGCALDGYDEVDLELRWNGGTSSEALAASLNAADGIYTWVPTVGQLSSDAKLHVVYRELSTGRTAYDEMDGTITIEDISLRTETVTAPSGGESYTQGPISITWTVGSSYRGPVGGSELVLDTVDIVLSRDGGATYPDVIAVGAPNLGSYTWVPDVEDYGNDCKLLVIYHNIVNTSTNVAFSGIFSFGGRPYVMANRSTETGLAGELGEGGLADAEPYSILALNYDEGSTESGSEYTDVFESFASQNGQMFRTTQLDTSGAPRFVLKTEQVFPIAADLPLVEHRGIASGNFDSNEDTSGSSDEGVDLFVARETGVRIYRNLGLNGGTTFQYTDVVGTLGIVSTDLDGSWCGAWADFDADGREDLLVGRATLPPGGQPADPPDPATLDAATLTLLMQQVDGTFVEEASTRGLTASAAVISLGVEDFNGDFAQDIVVGDFRSSGASRIYLNDGVGNFTEQSSSLPASVSGIATVDMNADGNIDLVFSRQSSAPALSAQIYPGNGDGTFGVAIDLNAGISQSGLMVFDHDANQTPDVLLLPADSGNSPRFYANLSTPSNSVYADRTALVQLTEVGKTGGVGLADFDGDGRKDVFFGRAISAGKFFYRSEKVIPAPDLPHFAVALEGGGGGNPESGSGAVVTVLQDGSPLQSQTMGATTGSGSQTSLPLGFVVEDDQATYDIRTRWPGGHIQTQSAQLNQLNTVQDSTDPTVSASSMTASYTPEVGGTMTFRFEWDTQYKSLHNRDRVYLSSSGNCMPNPLSFGPNHPDVTMQCSSNPDGSETHVMLIADRDCTPNCVYSWYCQSGTLYVTSNTSANPKTIKTKICVQ
jgi:hypothetical protein